MRVLRNRPTRSGPEYKVILARCPKRGQPTEGKNSLIRPVRTEPWIETRIIKLEATSRAAERRSRAIPGGEQGRGPRGADGL